MPMINLKKETLEILAQNNRYPLEVEFVTDGNSYISFDEFLRLADFEYSKNWGGNKIPLKLQVVGKDFWLERHEYDGMEWWEYKTMPKITPDMKNKPFFMGNGDE